MKHALGFCLLLAQPIQCVQDARAPKSCAIIFAVFHINDPMQNLGLTIYPGPVCMLAQCLESYTLGLGTFFTQSRTLVSFVFVVITIKKCPLAIALARKNVSCNTI